MSWNFGRIAALFAALLALQSVALPAQARIGSCPGCGTVTDVDAIYFARDKAPDGAAAGTIVGGTATGKASRSKTATGAAVGGVVGRKASGNQGDDARGVRLEVKMDGGGQRTIEITDGLRVYKGDRLRVHTDHVEMLD